MRVIVEILVDLAASYPQEQRLRSDADDDIADRRMSHEQWQSVYDVIAQWLPRSNLYIDGKDAQSASDLYDQIEAGDAVGDLADDLADIYRDLAPCVRAWRSSATPAAAIEWHLLFLFQAHWESHAKAVTQHLSNA